MIISFVLIGDKVYHGEVASYLSTFHTCGEY